MNAKVGHNPVPMNIPVILASGEHMGFAFAFVFLAGGSSVVCAGVALYMAPKWQKR